MISKCLYAGTKGVCMFDFFRFFENVQLRKDKGFDYQKLPLHTRVIFKTKNSVYQLELLENKKALMMGGTIVDKAFRFPTPVMVSPIGSAVGNAIIPKVDWIGYGMRFEFVVDETQKFYITTEIIDAEIHACDNSWHHFMHWGTDEPKSE